MALSVLLADDHEIIRYGVCLLLQDQPDIDIVGEACDGNQVLSMVEQLHPDMVLLDMTMPGPSGATLITELHQRFPALKILVLSMHKDQSRVLNALRAGAGGYVLKESQAEEIAHAVREVASGRRYLSPDLASQLVDSYLDGSPPVDSATLEELTARELEVIELAAEGLTSADIGKQLFISARTVETHRSRAMQKLNLRNHVELVRFFVKRELLREQEEG